MASATGCHYAASCAAGDLFYSGSNYEKPCQVTKNLCKAVWFYGCALRSVADSRSTSDGYAENAIGILVTGAGAERALARSFAIPGDERHKDSLPCGRPPEGIEVMQDKESKCQYKEGKTYLHKKLSEKWFIEAAKNGSKEAFFNLYELRREHCSGPHSQGDLENLLLAVQVGSSQACAAARDLLSRQDASRLALMISSTVQDTTNEEGQSYDNKEYNNVERRVEKGTTKGANIKGDSVASRLENDLRSAIETAPDNESKTLSLYRLGRLLKKTNRVREAEECYRRVVDIRSKSLGPDHPETKKATKSLERVRRSRATKSFRD